MTAYLVTYAIDQRIGVRVIKTEWVEAESRAAAWQLIVDTASTKALELVSVEEIESEREK